MNYIAVLLTFFASLAVAFSQPDKPLRVFIRAGVKTHGPGQHDHPRFLKEGKELLNQRGALADGALNFPSAEQLENSDVLVMYAAEGGTISPEQRVNLEKFLQRGGGIVVIHDAICGTDPQWFKTIVGGAWEHKHSKWFEGDVSIYYQDNEHPITKGVSNFDFDDEIYYDLHLMPEARILAASYAPDKRNTKAGRVLPSVYEIVPQMWTYEKSLQTATGDGIPYRAFVSIPGHNHESFNLPHYRAILLRGIAWAGKRDVDSLLSKDELASLRYPKGGPTAPEKAASQIKAHPDFNLSLVAAEPLIEKPISLDWDARGRMWVAETPEYPARTNEAVPPRDRISILEDSNGDGLMDKKSVFYDGLNLVTSLVLHRDGAIVAQAPDIYFLRDTDGDGKSDKKEVLYTGFGTRDTHAVISNMRWGMDGWIYATLGYSGGDIYSGDKQKHFGGMSSGVIRFKPDGSAMEQVSSKGGNTWGLDFAPDGELFFSQANGNHINHVVMTETALSRGRVGKTTSSKMIEDHNRAFPIREYHKQAYVQIDWVGNFTAASGACIYNGGAWPEKYNNTFYVTEPTINLVHQDFLKQEGVTYIASKDPERLEQEFLASTDLWFRPIHVRVGPDGAMYILDFYNQAAVHNDTRGPKHGPNNAAVRPDRDHYFGRIWRVQHKDAKKLEIPNLEKAAPQELVKALEHPNGWVRNTAQRLLAEFSKPKGRNYESNLAIGKSLEELAQNASAPENARILAYWTLSQLDDGLSDRLMKIFGKELADDKSAAVRKNISRICNSYQPMWSEGGIRAGANFPVDKILNDPDPRVQLEFLLALSNMKVATDISEYYAKINDPWRKSALVGIMAGHATYFFAQILNSKQPDSLKEGFGSLTQTITTFPTELISSSILDLANAPSSADSLKQIALETFAKNSNAERIPAWTPELQKAFQTLLVSKNPGVAAAALPLISRWDKNGAMAADLKLLVQQLTDKLNDPKQSDEQRMQIVSSLMSVRNLNPEILPSIAKILGSSSSPELQKKAIEALGETGDANLSKYYTDAYARLPMELQGVIFEQMIKRPEWSLAFLDAVKGGKVTLAALSPNAVHRLRTHSDKSVAQRANEVIDEIRGPQMKEKNALIAKMTPLVTQPGNVENGKKLFTQNCAVCHKFNGEGKEVAPDLTGMGAHGPADLIVHILDPNRVVEPNYVSYSIETTDEESYDGIVVTDTTKRVVLRNAAADKEILRASIKEMKSTGRSLMPEGFEALGDEGLRDLLSYICAAESKYRILDLTPAFTADSTKGIYSTVESTTESLLFKKFGLIKAGEVPFEIFNPLKTSSGNNLVVLKGGYGFSKTLPQRVEIPNVNLKTSRLHFLGGVGGWAWPWSGDVHKNIPVAKITIQYADNKTEEIILKNGVELADYNGTTDVPGSTAAPGLVERGQVRWFSKNLQKPGIIQKIILESFDNAVAPTFIGITAETIENK